MKKSKKAGFVTFSVILLLISASFSCNSVKRVSASEEVELDGFWSDTDVKIVCEDIVNQIISSPNIKNYYKAYGRKPIVTINEIKNESSEYIDTNIVADNLKYSILKSGVLDFMSNNNVRSALRNEIVDQANHAKEDMAKEFDNEDAADFMLTGSIRTMGQFDGKNTSFNTYFVTVELNDIESGKTIGMFQPSPENQPRKMIKGKKR